MLKPVVYLWLCLPQPSGGNDRGWVRNRDIDSEDYRLTRLRRVSATAEEGVFTCDIPGDNNTPRYLGIYYPSEFPPDVYIMGDLDCHYFHS